MRELPAQSSLRGLRIMPAHPGALLALAAFAALASVPALAEGRDAASRLCEAAARTAAQRHGVPAPVLLAVAHVETGRADRTGRVRPWPWAINMAGQGAWPRSRADALELARSAVQKGRRNIDLGCFQINYRWHGAQFASLDQMLDPDRNADYAARMLADLNARYGSWSVAAGAYHSTTPHLATQYRARFDTALAAARSEAPAALPPVPIRAGRARTWVAPEGARALFDTGPAQQGLQAPGSLLAQLAVSGARPSAVPAAPASAGAIALEAWR